LTRYISPKLIVTCLAAAMCAAPTLAATDKERVGNAAAVRGAVQLAAISGVREIGKKVASGEPIFLGDRVTTGPEGRLQIMLLDETVFTIGPKAAIVIDEFVYDPKTSKGKVAASVLKGTFRFVTGKVSKRDPSKMVVKLPVGSIGVRGTSVAGHTDGISATVVLLGPGPNSNTGERIGSITVLGQGVTNANASVEIVRPGFATRIGGVNQAPTPPIRMDPAQLSTITGELSGPPPSGPIGDGTGEPTGPRPPGVGPLGQLTGDSLADGNDGKDLAKLLPPPPDGTQFEPPPGDTTTYEQLRSISSGTANFAPQTQPIFVSGVQKGSYTVNYSYNFNNQTASGNVSITVGAPFTTPGTGGFPLLANPFSNPSSTGPVNITEGPLMVGTIGGMATFNYGFYNTNGVVFGELRHKLTYSKGATGTGTGKLLR
jgi:hypothetical protein